VTWLIAVGGGIAGIALFIALFWIAACRSVPADWEMH
jgi:hypothetical protein